MQDDEARPMDGRSAVLFAVARGIGDAPVAGSVNVWRLAELESRIDGLMLRREPIPEEVAREHETLRHALQVATEQSHEDGTPFTCGPLLQLIGAEHCLQIRPHVEAGEGSAVMEAAAICAVRGLVMPGWLAAAFSMRVDAVFSGLARTWEDQAAFGPAHPKGTNIAGVRAEKRTAPDLYTAALLLLEKDPAAGLDDGFYEILAEQFGMGSTRVQELLRKHVAGSDGAFPALSEVKPYLRDGMGAAEAVCACNEAKRWRRWQSNGGTAAQWLETFGRPPSRRIPES